SDCSPAYGCSYFGQPVQATSASIDQGVGTVAPNPGIPMTIYPSQSTPYTLSVKYAVVIGGFLKLPLDTATCKTAVNVIPQISEKQCNLLQPDVCTPDGAGYTHHLNDAQCSTVYVACPFAGFGYGCVGAPGNVSCTGPIKPVASLTAHPALVNPDSISEITWDVTNIRSCTVLGSNQDRWTDTPKNHHSVGSEQTSKIVGQTIYSLDCTGIDPAQKVHLTATVSLVPTFHEQ
ncbi:MAG TPA: hypothetical protein VN495_02970, partial [Candidatus Paceibacterota bacterium]|nr:hypothetical protein [Candidatus Paceibacterota bacterium]